MTDTDAFAGINKEIHERIRQLPEETRQRQQREQEALVREKKEAERQARNKRMREYMPKYNSRHFRHTVTLQPQEQDRLLKEVKHHGYQPAALLRRAAFAYFDGKPVIPRDFGDRLDAATVAINRIGNSINQLAHQANTRRKATHREVREARQLLLGLTDTVRRTLDASPAPAPA